MQCFLKIIRNEGPLALFKGIHSPLIAGGPYKALLMTFTDFSKKNMININVSQETKTLISACMCGALGLIAAVPFELLKCRAQINS